MVKIPVNSERNTSFFKKYSHAIPAGSAESHLTKLLALRKVFEDIVLYSSQYDKSIKDNNEDLLALQFLGQRYIELGMWGIAVRRLSTLSNLAPNIPEIYRYRGDAYLALGRHSAAISDYERAIELNPLDIANFLARGKGFTSIGEFDLARADFNDALKLNPRSSDAYSLRGHLYALEGNHSLAFTDLERAIEYYPLNHDAYFKRYESNHGLGNTSLALGDLEQAIATDPTNADYLNNRGLLRLESNDLVEALDDFQAAIDSRQYYVVLDPSHTEPFLGKARANLSLGNPGLAIESIDAAIRIFISSLDTVDWEELWPQINKDLADAQSLRVEAEIELNK